MAGSLGFIPLCLLLGVALRRSGRLPANAHSTLSSLILTVSVPAVTLLNMHGIQLRSELGYLIAMAWIVFALAWVFFALVGPALGWDKRTIGAMTLTAGLCNTSFVGFPMLVALFGPEALKTGIINDQPGSFLVLCTLGTLAASHAASRTGSLQEMLRRVVFFPPFIALLIALITTLARVDYPEALKDWLQKLSATLIPLALISVGLQIRLDRRAISRNGGKLALGLAYKLVLAPALIWLLYTRVCGQPLSQEILITIAQAAMAPMVTSAILAAEYELEPELASQMVAVGIAASLVTVPLWAHWLQG